VPRIAEQDRIVTEVDRLLSIAEEAEPFAMAQITRAARLRQSVLKTAFEGKLVPHDPSDEPASMRLSRFIPVAAPKTPRRRAPSTGDVDAT
jgi:type I restriction enzyme S subunit